MLAVLLAQTVVDPGAAPGPAADSLARRVEYGLAQYENSFSRFMPIWIPAAILGLAIVGLVALVLWGLVKTFRIAMPRTAVVTMTCAKEAFAQPVYWLIVAVGALLIFFFAWIPYNTFGEEMKQYKSVTLTVMTVFATVVALYMSSVSISEEIEGRTALTLLSKPILRRQFIIGKFFGILLPVAIVFLVYAAVFAVTVAAKSPYDAREMGGEPPPLSQCRREVMIALPNVVLAFLEASILAAVGVALSTRLSIIPNIVVTLSMYFIGHLLPVIGGSTAESMSFVSFAADWMGILFPVLDHFDSEGAIVKGKAVSMAYVGACCLYAVLYSGFTLLLALLLFEDRDLA